MTTETLPGLTGSAIPANSDPALTEREIADNPLLGRKSGEPDFNHSLGQAVEALIEESADSESKQQRRSALQSTLGEMDSSEITGFLAMLQNQEGWQMEAPLEKAPVIDIQAWQRQAATQDNQSLDQPVRAALGKAMDNYLPATEEKSRQTAFYPESTEVDTTLSEAIESQSIESQASLKRLSDSQLTAPAALMEKSASEGPEQMTPDVRLNVSGLTATTADRTPANPAGVISRETVVSTPHPVSAESAIRQENWSEAMGQRLVTMVGDQHKEAVIRLDPPSLGSLGIRLVVEDTGVSVQFQSAVPQVREMLEAQADRLRHALAGQGMNLINVNVSSDGSSDQPGQSPYTRSAAPMSVAGLTGHIEPLDEQQNTGQNLSTASLGIPDRLVDTFA